MTVMYWDEVQCGVCHNVNQVQEMASTSVFGSPDLDLRPPPQKRWSMIGWVQQCGLCGYCAIDLTQPCEEAGTGHGVLSEPAYRRQLASTSWLPLASRFLCKAMLDDAGEDHAAAFWARLHAAWVCDDSPRNARHRRQADRCRSLALHSLHAAQAVGQMLAPEQPGVEVLLLVDLLRRCGQMDAARAALAEQLAGVADPELVRLLQYSAALVEQGDRSAHTVAQAFGAVT